MTKTNTIGDFLDKVPPQNLEAERALLGSILMVNDAYDSIATTVPVQAFYMDAHRRIFAVFKEMYEAGSRAIDAVTFKNELAKRDELDVIGGVSYLLELFETVPHAAHAEYYAGIVREKWLLRTLIESATEILKTAYHGTAPVDQILANAERDIAAIGDTHVGQVAEMPRIVDELELLIAERIDTEGKSGNGLPTGFHDLDDLINGLGKKKLIVIAARPGMGKTALIGNVASHQARNNRPGMICSLEMGREELAERMLCEEARIRGEKLKNGDLDEIDHHEFSAASARMRGWPLLIDDEASQTVSYLSAKIRRAHRVHKIEWVVIDYLQLVEPDDPRMPREQQVATASRKFKNLSKQLDIPVILLAQLNRDVESREDKRPRLADLRESGAIEQDADVVIFIHRPDAYDPEDRPGEVDLLIRKNRNGDVGTVQLTWKRSLMKFSNWNPVDDGGSDF
jgi:replicative DNA helicase